MPEWVRIITRFALKAPSLELGDIATWVGAVETIGAFIATWMLLRAQQRELHLSEQDRRKDQARYVSAWCRQRGKALTGTDAEGNAIAGEDDDRRRSVPEPQSGAIGVKARFGQDSGLTCFRPRQWKNTHQF
jgi:hypothetical protein